MSNSRRQIEAWLKTIDVEGSVLDVGGLFWPVKGRTKSWLANRYVIADIKPARKGVTADFVGDFNYPIEGTDTFDCVFCLEVVDHFWNPVQAFQNIGQLAAPGGKLYVSANFLFPQHTGLDCLRLTDTGLKKILTETGFRVLHQEPRFAADIDALGIAMRNESKVYYSPGVIGWMLTAEKI